MYLSGGVSPRYDEVQHYFAQLLLIELHLTGWNIAAGTLHQQAQQIGMFRPFGSLRWSISDANPLIGCAPAGTIMGAWVCRRWCGCGAGSGGVKNVLGRLRRRRLQLLTSPTDHLLAEIAHGAGTAPHASPCSIRRPA